MHVEEDWTPCPDCDSDRVVPATYRNMAPWNSAFAQDGRLTEPKTVTTDAEANEQAPDGKAVDWLVWALMEHYNS